MSWSVDEELVGQGVWRRARHDGSDTCVIVDGKFRVQTMHYSTAPQ